MKLKEQLDDIFYDIRTEQNRTEQFINDKIVLIKNIIKGNTLTLKQQKIYHEWCIDYSVHFKESYITSLGGSGFENNFENPILQIAFEIDNSII